MNGQLRERILAYNLALKQQRERAEDMQVLAAALLRLPPGQLKRLLDEELLAVLAKYGPVE